MNGKLVVRLYGIISITLVILLLIEALIRKQIKDIVIVKVIDYCFWYVFGLFSALFIVRRILMKKERKDKENLLSPN